MKTKTMRKSVLRKKQKKSLKSFLSLPNDLVINCLSRVSRTHDPILSLVSKSFRSLLASPDLEAARSRMLKTESCLYVCLKLNKDHNPSWFILSQTPKPKLIPLASFPYRHPYHSTVVSTGSEIYMLGGLVGKGKKSRRAYVLDCKSYHHQWRRLPKMPIARQEAAANVVNGKIYVFGGCSSENENIVNWGEVYDTKTQTWEPFPQGEEDSEKGVVSCNIMIDGVVDYDCGLIISGKVYDNIKEDELYLCRNVCMVVIGDEEFQATVSNGKLKITVCKDDITPWSEEVGGLEGVACNYLLSVANPTYYGSSVTVWWKTFTNECKTEIWCAQISFEVRFMDDDEEDNEIWGLVEWSENVFTFHGSESDSSDSHSLLLHYELVTLGPH